MMGDNQGPGSLSVRHSKAESSFSLVFFKVKSL